MCKDTIHLLAYLFYRVHTRWVYAQISPHRYHIQSQSIIQGKRVSTTQKIQNLKRPQMLPWVSPHNALAGKSRFHSRKTRPVKRRKRLQQITRVLHPRKGKLRWTQRRARVFLNSSFLATTILKLTPLPLQAVPAAIGMLVQKPLAQTR